MIGPHARRAIGATVFAGALLACNAIIGTKDIFFDGDASVDDDGGTLEGGASSSSSSSSGSSGEGGAGDSGVDANCGADLQKDGKNCGTCGHDCLGGACNAGKCQPFALVTTGYPRYLALDATNIYYTDGSLDAVKKMPKAGGSPVDVCSIVGKGADSMVIDATNVYFTVDDGGPTVSNGGVIEKCALGGGAASIMTPALGVLRSLVLSGTTLFLVADGDPPTVLTMQTTGGSATPYFTGPAGGDFALVLGGGYLYAADDQANGKLFRCTVGAPCASPPSVANDGDGIDGVVHGTARLLWATGVHPGTIWQAQLDGGSPTKLTTGPPIPHTLAFDATHLYWLNAGIPQNVNDYFSGSVMRCPHTGGVVDCGATGPETLGTSDYHFIRGLRVDTNAIYWVEGTTIWRLAK
jgi:hypothetical protein